MSDQIQTIIELFSQTPLLQGALAACLTFILEDPTTVGSALLVADGKMHYLTALLGLSVGITLGDWGLYAIGRYAGPKSVAWGFVSEQRLQRSKAWFERNMLVAVFVSRFIPGLRLPANVGAGMVRASTARYLTFALTASLIWTFVMLTLISRVGEMVLPALGQFKWPAMVAVIAGVIVAQIVGQRRLRQTENADEAQQPGRAASPFEFWHPIFFYIPLAGYYLWLAIRYRSATLPTAANPSIYSGGMIGESKTAILDGVPDEVRKYFAPHTSFDRPVGAVSAEAMLAAAKTRMNDAGIAYPIVAKPDTGQRGVGVRPINNDTELSDYLMRFPPGSRAVLQARAPYENEMGVFYYRLPNADRGEIFSITHKEFPKVVGNGRDTLEQLIRAHPRAPYTGILFLRRHARNLGRILPEGEAYQLVFAGDHKQGCVFRDGIAFVTSAMTARIDEIARALPEFYFGRFDIRYGELSRMQRGEDFLIVEVNGAASEATHIWDPDARMLDAYRTLFNQYRVLFEIGHQNRAKGTRPLGAVRFLRDVFQYHRVARGYPSAE